MQRTFGNNVPYQVPVSTSPWVSPGMCISTNGSGFTYGDPSAQQGSQVGFIKDSVPISQTVTLETGVYDISPMFSGSTIKPGHRRSTFILTPTFPNQLA